MKNIKKRAIITILCVIGHLGCSPDNGQKPQDGHDHPHPHPHPEQNEANSESHEHDEVSLGKFDIDGIMVEAAQGHGNVEPGKEGHLVIKLPYNDNGQTTVRAWIGGNDRTLSSVGKGDYAASHDDYDIHAVAPDPMPENAQWWVEIEKSDGVSHVGSFPFL